MKRPYLLTLNGWIRISNAYNAALGRRYRKTVDEHSRARQQIGCANFAEKKD